MDGQDRQDEEEMMNDECGMMNKKQAAFIADCKCEKPGARASMPALSARARSMDVPAGTLAGKDARAPGDKRSHSFAYRYNSSFRIHHSSFVFILLILSIHVDSPMPTPKPLAVLSGNSRFQPGIN